MVLKRINTPIRFQHLTEDPNFTSFFQFSDPGTGNHRQHLHHQTRLNPVGGGA